MQWSSVSPFLSLSLRNISSGRLSIRFFFCVVFAFNVAVYASGQFRHYLLRIPLAGPSAKFHPRILFLTLHRPLALHFLDTGTAAGVFSSHNSAPCLQLHSSYTCLLVKMYLRKIIPETEESLSFFPHKFRIYRYLDPRKMWQILVCLETLIDSMENVDGH